MAKFRIQGGRIEFMAPSCLKGNKNAILPMLASCLLTDEIITLKKNIPLIEDVMVMLDLLESIGVKIQRTDHTITLQASAINGTELESYFMCQS